MRDDESRVYIKRGKGRDTDNVRSLRHPSLNGFLPVDGYSVLKALTLKEGGKDFTVDWVILSNRNSHTHKERAN